MDDDQQQPRRALHPSLISIIVVAILALGAAGIYALTQASTDADTPVASQQTTAGVTDEPTVSDSSASDASYKDGTYTETASYSTPGGSENLTVSLELKDGAISSISATGSATSGESSEHQGQFLSAYKSLVVGKSINAVKLSRVAGSSLTSNGFNAAIEKIKEDAEG